jgi:hypothetical protein
MQLTNTDNAGTRLAPLLCAISQELFQFTYPASVQLLVQMSVRMLEGELVRACFETLAVGSALASD